MRRLAITETRFLKTAVVITAFAAVVFAGMMSSSKRVRARDTASAVAVSYAHSPDDLASVAPVAPEHCKLLKEDAKVRVIHCILKKGDKVGMHSHPPFVVYFIKGGKSRYTLSDGTTRDVETKNDEAQILPPVTHSGEQLDDVDEILVELKQ